MFDRIRQWVLILTPVALLLGLAPEAPAAPPVVKTVPWVANNAARPHDTWSGKLISLKGTSDVAGANIQYSWDFGDGTPPATGIVSNQWAIEAQHAYTGATGTVYTARLTVTNTGTGESASQVYYVEMRDKTLQVEVNVAIDEGLWALHKQQARGLSSGVPIGQWTSAYFPYWGLDATSVTAFEVNGHVPNGDPSNPYVETVQRGLAQMFLEIHTESIVGGTHAGNPDGNGNGYGVRVNGSNAFYQGGMFLDALVASGTPDAVAPLGAAAIPPNPGILGRTYKDIVQDMVDDHAYCEYYYADYPFGGGWRYNCGDFPDNSVSQWAAIGLIAAERKFGATVPSWVKDQNVTWLAYSQNATTGVFGYTDPNPAWGPFATTASGMVQMVMDGIGRGQTGPGNKPSWDLAETFMRNNWDNTGNAYTNIKEYYYGLFSFTKSMLLSQPSIKWLHSNNNAAKPDIDWYAAEASNGDTSDGVARTLVNAQLASGTWYGHDIGGGQYEFETAWAVIMLNRTIFDPVPVAVIKVTPNPSLANQTITLDGSGSYHQDPTKHIAAWQWDLNNDGVTDKTGPVVTTSYPTLGSRTITLTVVDDSTPQPKSATTPATVNVTVPPVPPTAEAGGPYVFCRGTSWFLDGSRSVNPDNGVSEPGAPGDVIKSYAWDLYGNNAFNDAFGSTPNVTGSAWTTGDHIVQLKVTDSTGTSFPSSGLGDLSSVDSAQVTVKDTCTCVAITARAKSQKVELRWATTGADHYNIYRSQVSGGPYQLVGSTSSPSTAVYVDYGLTNGVTYYYMVREAQLNGNEICQSNQVSAKPISLF